MKLNKYLPEAPAALVLSEARKRPSISRLRQRYEAQQQATGRPFSQEFQQARAGQVA